jgi:parvulin-like peptidyl-prolyl isomerase
MLRRYLCSVLLMVFGAIFAFAADSDPAIPETEIVPEKEAIVARIGDIEISVSDFKRDLEYRHRRLQLEEGQQIEIDEAFRRETLDELIGGAMLKILAAESGIEVSDDEVETEFQKGRDALASQEAFEQYLESNKLTEELLRQQIRDRIRMQKFAMANTAGIEIDEEEIEAEYKRLRGMGHLDRRMITTDFAQILCAAEPMDNESWVLAKERIDAARARIEAGESFQEVAREVSDDEHSAPKGGVQYEAMPGVLPQYIDELLNTLEPGQLSEPFKSPAGWHIIMVIERNQPGVVPFEKAKDPLRLSLLAKKRQEALGKMIEAARERIPIEIIRAGENNAS